MEKINFLLYVDIIQINLVIYKPHISCIKSNSRDEYFLLNQESEFTLNSKEGTTCVPKITLTFKLLELN